MSVSNPAPITYVVVRTDLSLEQQLVQAVHASMGAAARFGDPPHNHVALLAVPDRAALERAAEDLTLAGIPFHIFFEPDDDAGWTALATQPLTRREGRLFRNTPLWRAPSGGEVVAQAA